MKLGRAAEARAALARIKKPQGADSQALLAEAEALTKGGGK